MSEATTAEAVSEARPVPEERLLAISADEAFQVRCWWQRLTLPAAELKAFSDAPPWPKGVRATLRRCDTVEAAMLTEGFRLLWHRLSAPEGESEKQRNYRLQTWACIALVLAEDWESARVAAVHLIQDPTTSSVRIMHVVEYYAKNVPQPQEA